MKRWLAIFAVVFLSLPCFAQGGSQASSVLRSTAGASGATIRVCTSTASGTPCSPLANIYTDAALTVPKSNPFAADSVGNYGYYASPRIYKEQVTVGGSTFTQMVTVPEDGGFPLSGVIITRTQNGANHGERLANCIAALPATGGACDARSDVLTPIWNLDPFAGVTKPVRVMLGAATIAVNVDVTAPSNITIDPYGGALFQVASGKTLTVNGPMLADPYQRVVDLSAGGVVFFAGGISYPGWFGAVADGRATTHAEITSANPVISNPTDSPWTSDDCATGAGCSGPADKVIVLYSATYPGQVTTIVDFTDSANITLAVAPTSTTTVNAVWGTDDTDAIQAAADGIPAVTPNSAQNTLQFPGGIYLMSEPIVYTNAAGLRVQGDGPGSPGSLGNYNLNGQPGGGTSLVWIGPVGGVIGCTSASGAPPAGVDDALTNCTAAESYMMKLSGQFILEDINLQGARRASHLLEIGGGDVSNSFSFSVRNFFGGYATQYGMVIGGTNVNQPGSFGEAYFENISLSTNGLYNSALLENDPTCGGAMFFRYGPGNFQKQFDTGYMGGGGATNLATGCHHIFWYNGQTAVFTNVYFAPLNGNSTPHSSVYVKTGNFFTFDNVYDENGWMIHDVAGDSYTLNQVQMRQNPGGKPHVAAQFDSSATVALNSVRTEGLPIVFKAGGKVTRNNVGFGNFGTAPAYPFTLCAGAGCITRSGSTVTLTTTATHSYLAGDWIELVGIADATYNGIFKVVAPVTATQFDVVNAAAVGASTEGGTVGLACCVVAETATSYTPQWNHPFVSYLETGSGALTARLASAVTNIANKNAFTMIPGNTAGSAGASLPATIPAGWHFLDMRGNGAMFLGGPFVFGTAANPAVVDLYTGLKISGAAATGTILRGNGTQYVPSTNTWPDTTTVSQLLYATGTNVIGSSANLTYASSNLNLTGGGFVATKNGSDSVGAGPNLLLTNVAGTNRWYTQLSASGHLDFWSHVSGVNTMGFRLLAGGGRVMTAGAAPTCTFTSGGGTTPSCALDTGSTDTAGTIIATTGTGSPGTAGTITLTFTAAYGTNKPSCNYTLSNDGAGTWNVRATVIDETPSTTSDLFNWDNNSVALGVSTAFHVNYHCIAK